MPEADALLAPHPRPPHTHSVGLFGDGLLAAAVAELLGNRATVQRLDGPEAAAGAACSMLVVATDGWDTSSYSRVRQASADLGVPWLPVRAELGAVVTGPVERPGVAGCVECAELRRRHARRDLDEHDAVFREHGPGLAQRPSSWLTGLAAWTVAALVGAEIGSLLPALPGAAGSLVTARTLHAILRLDLQTLTVTRHRFLPDPLCPQCGSLPEDTADLARITLASRPKPAPGTVRVRPMLEEFDQLTETYVDPETGVIPAVNRSAHGGLVTAVASTRHRMSGASIPGSGRSRAYRTSELTAVLETLERYGGATPGGTRTAVRASYAELTDRALDPRTLGVHPPESYGLPGFRYRRFGEDQVCDWVWGYSFARAAPILVPESCAYHHVHRDTPEGRPFFAEVSNGCALGSCLEEAILHGVLEVAERDAFLMTWYARLPAPRIDLGTARNRTVPLQATTIAAETGYEVMAFDVTMEHGLPSVWTMAVSPEGRDAGPKLLCAAGSHLTLERAVLHALAELGPLLVYLIERFPAEADRARQMAADPSLVTTMEDHSTLYGAPEVFDRLRFLHGSGTTRGLPDATAGSELSEHTDLRDDLNDVLDRFLTRGMDVIVVNQTTPEHHAGGLACVKVLIPGMLPMTFGHHYRRVDNLPRLYEVPHLLRDRDRPLRPEEINPHPHPFP